MKIVCKKSEIQKILKRVNSVKSSTPTFSFVKIECSGDGIVKITKCSQLMQLSSWGSIEEFVEGACVIDGKLLAQVIDALEGNIEMEHVENDLIVRDETRVFTLRLLVDELPAEIQVPTGNEAFISGREFRKIEAVFPCVSTDSGRKHLTGIHLSKAGDELTVTGTNGTMLAVSHINYDPNVNYDNFEIVLPYKGGLDTIINLMGTEEVENVLISHTEDCCLFSWNNCSAIIKTLDVHYPDCSKIIPDAYEFLINGNTRGFSKAVKGAMIINPDVIDMEIKPASMRVSARSEIVGQAEYFEYLEIQNGNVEHEITLNPAMISKLFRFLGENTSLRFNKTTISPIKLDAEFEGFCEFYLMPMRRDNYQMEG